MATVARRAQISVSDAARAVITGLIEALDAIQKSREISEPQGSAERARTAWQRTRAAVTVAQGLLDTAPLTPAAVASFAERLYRLHDDAFARVYGVEVGEVATPWAALNTKEQRVWFEMARAVLGSKGA